MLPPGHDGFWHEDELGYRWLRLDGNPPAPGGHVHGDPGLECTLEVCLWPDYRYLCSATGPRPGVPHSRRPHCSAPAGHYGDHTGPKGQRWAREHCCPGWHSGHHKFSCPEAGRAARNPQLPLRPPAEIDGFQLLGWVWERTEPGNGWLAHGHAVGHNPASPTPYVFWLVTWRNGRWKAGEGHYATEPHPVWTRFLQAAGSGSVILQKEGEE